MSSPLAKSTSGTPAEPEQGGLPKIEAEKAAEILELYEPSEEAAALLQEGMAPDAFLEALLSQDLVEDAISFLAYGLPRREAIWWGLRCLHENTPEEVTEEETAAIASVDTWLGEPSDENSRRQHPAQPFQGNKGNAHSQKDPSKVQIPEWNNRMKPQLQEPQSKHGPGKAVKCALQNEGRSNESVCGAHKAHDLHFLLARVHGQFDRVGDDEDHGHEKSPSKNEGSDGQTCL